MINAGINGAVTWVDLSTPDVSSAVSFYRELLGWADVEESDTPMGKYYIGKVGERQAGGLMGQGPEMAGSPAMWTTFIYADDIEATVAKVERAGGTVLEKPFDIPGGAQVAVVADPTGAMFGVFAGPEIEGEFYSQDPGRVCWVELLTRDLAAEEVFYADLFGWRAETDDSGDTPYTVFKLGEEMVAGMILMPEMVPAEAPSHWAAYFTVADCSAAEARVAELGGQVLVPTMAIDMGKFAVLADPQGATFNIMEYAG
jgi:predicted enzyme related to lactoylglutathione lyase